MDREHQTGLQQRNQGEPKVGLQMRTRLQPITELLRRQAHLTDHQVHQIDHHLQVHQTGHLRLRGNHLQVHRTSHQVHQTGHHLQRDHQAHPAQEVTEEEAEEDKSYSMLLK